jgi:hypothetical protein
MVSAESYTDAMKCRLDPQTTPEQKFSNFQNALRQTMRVSKEELGRRIEADNLSRQDKPKRGPKPKTLVSARASGNKG